MMVDQERKKMLIACIKLYLEFIRGNGGSAKNNFTQWVDKELLKARGEIE